MVRPGKPVPSGCAPPLRDHYQLLPPGLIKPNTPDELVSIDPYVSEPGRVGCERPLLCDRHATESHGPWTGGPHPTTTPDGVQRPDTVCEASKFGKEFLRMAGIVQMLHAL